METAVLIATAIVLVFFGLFICIGVFTTFVVVGKFFRRLARRQENRTLEDW